MCSAEEPFINVSTGQIDTIYPDGCLEGLVGCPGDDLFNSLFMLRTELTKCIVPGICEVAFQGDIRASRAMMSFDAVKHQFGNLGEVAVLATDRNVLGEERGSSAFFIYHTWAIITMEDIQQHMLLRIP